MPEPEEQKASLEAIVQDEQRAVAVVLDLVQPAVTCRRRAGQGRAERGNKGGGGATRN
jgi:hypothetical protein